MLCFRSKRLSRLLFRCVPCEYFVERPVVREYKNQVCANVLVRFVCMCVRERTYQVSGYCVSSSECVAVA